MEIFINKRFLITIIALWLLCSVLASCEIRVKVTDDMKESFFSAGIEEDDFVVDYTDPDFAIKENVNIIAGLHSTFVERDAEDGALKATVSGDDAFFTVLYDPSMTPLVRDGEYHTFTVDRSKLAYWKGDILSMRMDFCDRSSVGDTIYIKSIKLSK